MALASLDAPSAFAPEVHVAVDEQLPWHKPWDGLARVEGSDLPDPIPAGWRPSPDPSVGTASVVSLRPIDDDNRMAVIRQGVSGAQMRFVAPNVMSLLQARVCEEETWLRAIYAGDVPVGLCLVEFATEDELELPLTGQPFLWRFLVDEHYQGMGFGGRAIDLLVDAMKLRGAHTLFVSCVPGTGSPKRFYEAAGFDDTGKVSDGEVILAQALTGPA